MKMNQQLLVAALVLTLSGAGVSMTPAHASDRVTSDDVTFVKPAAKKSEASKEKPEAAAKTRSDHDYDHCLALVGQDPQDALEYAQEWQVSTEQVSLAARHCAALAMSGLGRHHDAAIAL